MNFETYRPLALRTAKMFPTEQENLQHAVLGLTTEIGEFATEVKRMTVYGRPCTEEMHTHMVEEIGDAQWYVPLAMRALDIETLPAPDRIWDEAKPYIKTLPTAISAIQGATTVLHARLLTYCYPEDRIVVSTSECAEALSAIVSLCDLVAGMLSVSPDDVRAMNIAKLRKRFPDAYSDAAAEARADKGGLSARES